MSAAEALSGSLTDYHPVSLRGNIDLVTEADGIVGWLVDVKAPARRHRLELLSGERVVATCETVLYRDDLGFPDVPEMSAGFRFPPTSLLRLLELAPAERPGRLVVRVAETPYQVLRGARPLETEQVARLAEQIAENRPEGSQLDPHDFLLSLQERRSLASALLSRPFRPQSASEAGYLELVCPISSDLLLFIGWIRSKDPIDLAAVIVSGQKFAAGLRGFTYPRPDLPADAMGFAALVRTEWRPTLDASFILYWGNQHPRYIQSNRDWRMISVSEATRWLADLVGKVSSFELAAIHRNIGLLDTWEPSDVRQAQAAIHYGIDRILVVPEFGAFVQGWLLSPWKRVRHLSLRMRDQVLQSDPRCLSLMPRPDLASAFVHYADATSSAGFRAVFRGGGEIVGERPLLKLHFEDGSTLVLAVDPKVVRVCDGSDVLPSVTGLCPSLPHESFFDDFVTAFSAIVHRNGQDVRNVVDAPCRRAVILALPLHFDDMYLALEAMQSSAAALPPDVGFVLLCTASHARVRILARMDEFRNRTKRPISLFEIRDPAYVLWSLTSVIAASGIEDFWFISPLVLPTALGWRTAADRFARRRAELEMFVPDGGPNDDGAEEPTSLSFAWSAGRFGDWAKHAPVFLGGFFRDNMLPRNPAPLIHSGTITRLRPLGESAVIRQGDRRISEWRHARNSRTASVA